MLVFELLDEESPGHIQVRNQVEVFLQSNERRCVTLMSHFLKKDSKILYIVDEKNKMWGVVSLTENGQLAHCIEDSKAVQALRDYFAENPVKKIFSIMGEKKYTEELEKVFLSLNSLIAHNSVDYYLMEYDSFVAEQVLLTVKDDPHKRQFLSKCHIFKCKESDFNQVFPLQKAYELEEVVIDPRTYSEKSTRILLTRAIANQSVFALRYDGKIIGKASFNAFGKNYIQLGGIYTDGGYRNNGVATLLVKTLSLQLKKADKKTVLFVKKSNRKAISVYENCGFHVFADYKISYYI